MKKFIKKNKFLERFARQLYSYIPYEKRKLDNHFYSFMDLLHKNEKKSIEDIKKYQFEKLKEIVDIAYTKTDFYKKKYDNAKFHPNDLKTLNDLAKIPLLTKDEVRSFSDQMVDRRMDITKLYKGNTSGTTGTSLKLYFDKKTVARELASISYQWERIGYKIGDGRVELRGFIEDDRDFIHFPDEKVLRINIIKMDNNNINKIISKIKKLDYRFILGYPSAIFKFAKIIESNDFNFSLNGIMMASEVLYDWQMEFIDKIFDCPKIIHYGQAEKVSLGAWDVERKYSFIPTYGIVEFDENTKELISTGLINEVMPFIRYQLTDTVSDYSDIPMNKNKTLFPVIANIVGREEDYTYDENENLIPPAIVTFPFKQLKYISAAKIIQNKINDFELVLETIMNENDQNLQNEITELILNFKKLYGNSSQYTITLTNKIPLGANGKFRWIECKII